MWRAGVPRVRRSPASFSLAAASTWPCCRTPPWISQRCLESQSLRDRTGGGGRSGGGEGQDSGATQRCESSTLLQSAHCLSVTTTGGRVPWAPPVQLGLRPVLRTASGTHLLAGRVHSLWQVLHGLVHQPFPGQAPIGCWACAGVLSMNSKAQL